MGGGGVRAWVRKRPLLAHEVQAEEYDAISVTGENSVAGGGTHGGDASRARITTHTCLMKPDLRRMFIRHAAFAPNGGVFGEHASSEDVYASVGAPLVQLALRGGRGTLLLYGQTGSGKTMTMSRLQVLAAREIFGEAAAGAAAEDTEEGTTSTTTAAATSDGAIAAAAVEVTAIEVAGKNCRDLHSGKACAVLQTAEGGATLQGAVPYVATSAIALIKHLRRVLTSRATEATSANATSSRSHAILTMRVGVDGAPPGVLTLLDCAGSEWAADSDAHDAKRRREGAEINASLHALKQCVRVQGEKSRGASVRVPYRDSVLTRLLRPAFVAEGNVECRLEVVGCVSPGAADAEHSTSTLRAVLELSGHSKGAECVVSNQNVPRVRPA